jgi:hypothetical protein
MIDLEFLKQYPLSTIVIRDWFHERMIESFKDPEIAEEFKEFVLEQGMEVDKIAFLINSNPRMLLDVFDENEIYISVFYTPNTFMVSINQSDLGVKYNTRKEAEIFAVEAALELLDKKLAPIYFPKLEE